MTPRSLGNNADHKIFSRRVVIPDLDHPLGCAGQEDAGHERVPGDVVDRCVVRRIGLEIPAIKFSYDNLLS